MLSQFVFYYYYLIIWYIYRSIYVATDTIWLNEAYIGLFHKVLGKQRPAGQELPVGYVAVKRVTAENANCVFFLPLAVD